MKLIKTTFFVVVLASILYILANILFTLSFKPREHYPNDTYLSEETDKVAMVITAHDDEAVSSAGTMAELIENGWQIDFVTTYLGVDTPLEKLRKSEANNFGKLMGFRNVHLIDFNFQQKKVPYIAIPYCQFDEYFYVDSLEGILEKRILESQPSVIFSLDDQIGGYGHSEHVLISRLAKEVSMKLNKAGKTNVKKVYQCVYPPSMAKIMMSSQEVYKNSQRIYQVDGMPIPTVQVPMSHQGKVKMESLEAFDSQKNNLKKFFKQYNILPHWLYFRIFSHEYFNVIDL